MEGFDWARSNALCSTIRLGLILRLSLPAGLVISIVPRLLSPFLLRLSIVPDMASSDDSLAFQDLPHREP